MQRSANAAVGLLSGGCKLIISRTFVGLMFGGRVLKPVHSYCKAGWGSGEAVGLRFSARQ